MFPFKKSLLCLFIVGFAYQAQGQDPGIVDSTFFKNLSFRNVGPTRGGRATTVQGAVKTPGTFYMGTTGGGVWKTEDYGINWSNVSDGFFKSPSIGAIKVYQEDPKIIYVGTGSDGIRSNIIVGDGMYKSENAGKTWTHIGLEKAGQIGAVEVHPTNANLVYVAAQGQPFNANEERGVYRTNDGGKSWKKILYVSDSVGAIDIEFAPNNPNIIYAAMWRNQRTPWTIISGANKIGGVYKSVDGGDNWKKVTTGLPQGLIGKIDFAVSPADPNRLYALVEAPKDERGVYRSDDQGESFKLVSNKKELTDRPFYYCNIDANPLNADVIFVMATNFYKSKDAGKKWAEINPPHGDNHDMWMNPSDTSQFIQSNDGGANITTNGGKSWSTQHNQPTAELYQVEVDDQYPYWLYAGQQDNSTISVPSLPPYDAAGGPQGFWMAVGGCETGPAVPKPGNPNIVYSNCKGNFGVYDKRSGQERQYHVGAMNIYGHNPKDLKYRFQRVSPLFVSFHNPDVVYYGSQYLHKTTNDGVTWETISGDLTANEPGKQVISGSPITRDITGEEYYSTLYEINESRIKEGLIWTGANDGPIHVTKDGGKSWENVTPKQLPPGGRVDCIEPSPHKEGKAYAAILRYQLGDWKPYIYKTLDYGKSWTLLTTGTNGIPEGFPTRTVREDPEQEGLLYAGTEYGLFISFNDGATWQSFQNNLPVTPVTDIKVYRNDLIISTMGRSFWIMDNISSLHQLAKAKQSKTAFLFKPDASYRMYYRGTGKNSVPSYPAPGVTIDYDLKSAPEQDIKLEIINPDNKVIRTFTSAVPPKDTTKVGIDMATGFETKKSKSDLSKEVGVHRFRWDLNHEGPWDKDPARSKSGGPTVRPGTYQARLTVNGETTAQTFEVKVDPKLDLTKTSMEDIKAQETLSLQVVALEDSAKHVLEVIKTKRKELEKLIKAGKNKKQYTQEDKRLALIQDQLATADGIYMTPMLIDQLRYLRGMLSQADQKPGKDAYERFDELKSRFNSIMIPYVKLEPKM
jgi:photosystem II stability/assembly factor-like uncharacterized protein